MEYKQFTAFAATTQLLANYSHAKKTEEHCRYVLLQSKQTITEKLRKLSCVGHESPADVDKETVREEDKQIPALQQFELTS